jgi:putative addiction module killer protein
VAKIAIRIDRLGLGNPGDVKPVGDGVSEMRIDHGLGYRVYFAERHGIVVILPCGGTKKTQQRDIKEAKRIYQEWKDQK